LMLVPGVNFIMLIILAFSEWPIQRENAMLRAQLAGAGAAGAYPGGAYASAAPPTYGAQLPPPGTPPMNPGP
jgi:hypothetical protein